MAVKNEIKGVNAASPAPTSGVGDNLTVGTPFDVTFISDAFIWETGAGYSFAKFNTDWIVISPDNGEFTAKVKSTNEVGGLLVIEVTPTKAYSGSFSLALRDATAQTPAFTKPTVKVTDPNEAPKKLSGVQAGGGSPSSTVGAALPVGAEFIVTFNSTAFNWAQGGSTYDFGDFNKTWVQVSQPTAFEVLDAIPSTLNGSVNVRIKTKAAYNGTVDITLKKDAAVSAPFRHNIVVTAEDGKIQSTKTGGTAPKMLSTATTIKAGERVVFGIPADNFNWSSDWNRQGSTLTDISWVKLSGATTKDFQVAYEATGTGDVRVVLTAIRPGTYKNLQVSLQGGTGGVATGSSAATTITVTTVDSGKITGISSGALLGGRYSGALLNGKSVLYRDLSNLEVGPDDELLIPLKAGFFTWSGTTPYSELAVTKSQLNAGRIQVATSGRTGSKAFADTKPEFYFKNNEAYIRVRFAKDAALTKDLDYAMTIYLTVDKKRDSDSALELAGTMVFEVYDIWDDESYVDISDGLVVEADKYLRNVELYLGDGVTAFVNLAAGRKYSGTATSEPTRDDDKMMERHPEIEMVYTLKTSGFTSGNCKVEIDAGSEMYVYNGRLEYIGTTDEKLPLSEKYYLTAKKMTFVDDDDYEPDDYTDDYLDYDDDEPGTSTAPPLSSSATSTNSNGNPKTGRY